MTFEEELYERFACLFLGERLPIDILNAQNGELIIPARRKITKTFINKLVKQYLYLEIDPSPIRNRVMQIIFETEKKYQ